ncbi:Uma2 family endonuclease [Micromonospora sp. bgisy143]|uniref:Uma2 family endonuclease n=1 Tax=Micromonospora sp. bgisy143 TaxID=3413790 RepID=UPI003EBFB2B0
MTREPTPISPEPWRPDQARQQRADHTLDDLLTLPDGAPRVELVDGVVQVPPLPTLGHQDLSSLLYLWLRSHAPIGLRAAQAIGIAFSRNTVRRPDVLLCQASVPSNRYLLRPEDVMLAVEIVSPGTRRIDRFAKPGEYAAAGIPYYWRIEQDPVHVYAYRIGDRVGPGGERQYELVADGADVIELAEPFDIKLPIAEITP